MAHQSDLIAEDIHAYLKQQEQKSLLRFITCGSVDDGKSTLIGRLLWDSKMIFEDQLATLEVDSKKCGTQGNRVDYALLLDGLQAEREQGITIDVAYRFFSTDKRKFIVADTPGHEQYTRNMVTGASTAQVAVILVDARKGVLTQTRRHSYLTSLVGIRHVVLAINKMDLIDYNRWQFENIRDEYLEFSEALDFDSVTTIPLSALEGDNILQKSKNTPWYQGPTLMTCLETVVIDQVDPAEHFRMRVQWVNRPHLDFRGFCGTVSSGKIRCGDEILIGSSGKTSRVTRLVAMGEDLDEARAGQAITICLADEIDISRGDLLSSSQKKPHCTDGIQARLVWLDEESMRPQRNYLLKAGAATIPVRIDKILNKMDVNNLKETPGTPLKMNDVGVCSLTLNSPLLFDRYSDNPATGSFIMIDRFSNATVAAGMIIEPSESKERPQWQTLKIDKAARAALKQQTPKVLCLSGQPGATQEKVATLVEQKLHSLGRHAYLLATEFLKEGLNRDLDNDNVNEEARRLSETARILLDAGLIAIIPTDDTMNIMSKGCREFSEQEFVKVYLDNQTDPISCPESDEPVRRLPEDGAPRDDKQNPLNPSLENKSFVFRCRDRSPEQIALSLVSEFFQDDGQLEWEI